MISGPLSYRVFRETGPRAAGSGREEMIFEGPFLILRVGKFCILRELTFLIVIDWFLSLSLDPPRRRGLR